MNPVEGRIVAVSMSPKHEFPTKPHTSIYVGWLGIPDDAHSGAMRQSFTQPGKLKKNDRPICIVAAESMWMVNQQLGINMEPGHLNEQIMVEGLGDLGWVPIGAIIRVAESTLELEIVDYAYPCMKLANFNFHGDKAINELLIDSKKKNQNKKPYSKRGILAQVRQPGELKPGDRMIVEVANQ